MEKYEGVCGDALRIPDDRLGSGFTVACWIVTAPVFHPLWPQYSVSVVSLREHPEAVPPKLHRPGMTHELCVLALNPEHGPYGNDTRTEDLRYLTPVNIAEQFTATDEIAARLCQLSVRAVCDGLVSPETADAPERIRAQWRHMLEATLDHHVHPERHLPDVAEDT